MTTNRFYIAIALGLLCGGAASARDGLIPGSGGEDRPNPNVRFDQKIGDKVPFDLTFTDEDGNDTTIGQCVDGKPTILIMAYYRCPMLCGQVFVGVLEAVRSMKLTVGKDFNIVCVSFDPKEKWGLARDKRNYFVTEYGRKEAHGGWRFLTGKQENITNLTNAVGFHYEYDRTIKEYNHPSGIIIVTPQGIISRYLPGIEYTDQGEMDGQPIKDKTRTLRLSLVEASEGKLGDVSDRLFLSCYRYSPHTGKYTMSVMWIVRAGALLTLLIIAGVYARVAWKIPGARVMVIGILFYVSLLPIIMFTSFSVDSLPKWATLATLPLVAVLMFVVGRWIWRSAKARGSVRTPVHAATGEGI